MSRISLYTPTPEEMAVFDAVEDELAQRARQALQAGMRSLSIWIIDLGQQVALRVAPPPPPASVVPGLPGIVTVRHNDSGRTGLSTPHFMLLQVALQEAVSDGFVVPGVGKESYGGKTDDGHFAITPRGLLHYGTTPRPISLRRASDLVEALRALPPGAVEPGQLAVLEEARVCWSQGCYRAATVLIGVASEASLRRLLDILAGYQHRSPGSSADWKRIDDVDPVKAIGARFEAGLSILRRLEEALQKEANAQKKANAGAPPAWAGLWWRSLGPLEAVAEAVRYARNAAAHDDESAFRRSDVGLLLAAMPTVLGHVQEVAAFLQQLEATIAPGAPPKV